MSIFFSKRVVVGAAGAGIALLVSVLPLFSYAQFPSASQLATSPAHPKPQSTVVVSLEAYGEGTDGAAIRWFVDGEEQPAADNGRTLSVQTGALGTQTHVEARITPQGGGSMTLETTLRPGDIDIIVEPDTYTPASYQGRALPTFGSDVRLIAVPHVYAGGIRIAPENLVYTWRVNGTTLFQGTRLGQNTALFTMPNAGAATIIVRAETRDGTRAAESSMELRSADPAIVFYQDDPLFGTMPLSAGRLATQKEELTVRAEPFFFDSAAVEAANTERSWTLDGRTINNPSAEPNAITLRRSGGTAEATVSFTMRNINGMLQSAQNTFEVFFTSGFMNQ